MMKNIWTSFLILLCGVLSAQHVGVNAVDPQTSLDIEGALRMRNVDLNVLSNQVTLLPNVSNVRLNGIVGAPFTINESGQEVNGQILVLTNSTNQIGYIYDYVIKPGQTMIFLRNDDGFIPVDSADAWKVSGNYGTNPATDFIGTLDVKDLVFRTQGTEKMRLTTGGFLGIGTSTPTTKFSVSDSGPGPLARFNSGTNMWLAIAEAGIDRGYIGSYAGNAVDVDFGTLSGNSAGKTHLTTLNIPRMTVMPDGKVGVGTTTPTTPFEVSNTTTNHVARFNGGNGMWVSLAENGVSRGYIGSYSGDEEDIEFGTYSSNATGRVHLSTVNESRLFVEPNGNVGIGLGPLTAFAKLHIIGGQDAGLTIDNNGYLLLGELLGANLAIDNNEILARNGIGVSDLSIQRDGGHLLLCGLDQGNVGIGLTGIPATRLQIMDGENASFTGHGYLMLGPTSGANIIMDDNEILSRNNGAESDLFIQQDGGDVLLCANEAGGVGIGLTAGSSIPEGSLLAVDGKITCEEVLVKLSQNWPDYVFDPNYPLKPLSEVKAYIDTHQHLPGIPDASTVREQGIELGEMQRMLMEKIEELTLYVIQLESEMQALKEKLEK